MGIGPMTGRAAGYCAGYGKSGYANPIPGRGLGMGRGRGFRGRGFGGGGRGWRHWFYATGQPGWMRFGGYAAPYQGSDPQTEIQALKSQAEALESELDSVRKRIDELGSRPAEE